MLRSSFFAAVVVGLISSANSAAAQSHPSDAIVGAWTLNKDKSDPPPADGDRPGRDDGRDRGDRGGRGGPGGPGGGFGGGGGRGGGFGGGRGGPGPGRGNEQEMQRRRDALRAILEPAERMTITRTDTMVIITTGDGHTTRLATDGSKVKDESTGFEQRTRWEGDRLVTEISGAARGKIVETYAPDPEDHELVVTIQLENGANPRGQESGPSGTRKRVYELTQSQ